MPSVLTVARSLAAASALTLSACVLLQPAVPGDAPSGGAEATSQPGSTLGRQAEGRITVEQLEELIQGFADRYYALVSSAADQLARKAQTPEARLEIDRFQARTVTAVYDIASNPDPFSQLLDMTVVVTLVSTAAIDEARAEAILGPDAEILTRPLRQAREEIWEIAGRALTPDQLETLDRLILDWRRANPDVESVSFIRFDDFATSRGKSVIADVPTGTGLLAPVDSARKSADEARLFAERVFYLAKRIPLLVSMESEHLLSQAAATPEVRDAFRIADRLADSAERFSVTAESLPAVVAGERERLVESIDRTSGALGRTLEQYQSAVARTDELVQSVDRLSGSAREVMTSLDGAAASLTTTIQAAERLAETVAGPPPAPGEAAARGTDPEVYARMVADLKASLVELNRALESTRSLADGPLWQRPVDAADKAAAARIEQASAELRSVADLVFWRALILLGAATGLLMIYRLWSARIAGRTARQDAVA